MAMLLQNALKVFDIGASKIPGLKWQLTSYINADTSKYNDNRGAYINNNKGEYSNDNRGAYINHNTAGKKKRENEGFVQGFTFKEAMEFLVHLETEVYTPKNRELVKKAPASSSDWKKLIRLLDKNHLLLYQFEARFHVMNSGSK